MKGITNKQAEIINVISNYIKIYKEFPSLSVIGKVVGCTKQAVYCRTNWLVKKGYLKNIDGKYAPTQEGISIMIANIMATNN